ncbi:MAG: class I SAM-dependent methyltransferase [Gemmatimonadaceae bacterium]
MRRKWVDSAVAQRRTLDAIYYSADAQRRFAQEYLLPPEAMVVVRYASDFVNARVLDVGVGPGRTTRYLSTFAREYVGIDYSPAMVSACRRQFPGRRIEQVDVRDLRMFGSASFDTVFAPSAVLDALSHEDRLLALSQLRQVLAPRGLFVFSSHNREWERHREGPKWEFSKDPLLLLRNGMRYLRDRRNHIRYQALQLQQRDYAILNDGAYEWRALHYYITRDAQVRQLADAGFTVLECLSMNGAPATDGWSPHDYKLHYVCRRTPDES